ncbi:hypothetical protein Agub_g11518 [Astrephomene gubernaculifera]|uniref:serine--tRNA ligase n=1 Tax=Astrephomene gubernaculifera TaxID=47775 RepID=A0AAD3HQJ2_9CHLO|nr:hypothetical protein Agub_g11518 [Astrephomene gubernaculifera]
MLNQLSPRRAALQGRAFQPANTRRCRPIAPLRSVAVEAPATQASAVEAPSFRAHLDFKFIKENVDMIAINCKNRLSNADPYKVVALYDEFVALKSQADSLRAERNENSNAMKAKLDPERRAALISRGQALKEQLAEVEGRLAGVESSLQREGQRLPNLTHPDVPLGGEGEAVVVREVGSPRVFSFPPRDHVALAEGLDMVDFEAAAEVTGQKFYYLRNAGALLEMALVNWAMNKVVSRGFTPLMTPDLVKASVLEKCGFQPRGAGTQVYSISDSPLCLTGTAEVPLAGLYMERVLTQQQLPLRLAAFGHCFRTEAGAAGLAGKGLFRVHQFSKVEMFVLCEPGESEATHAELAALEEEMYGELGLHFKVLDMPSGDLGAPAFRKYDVEAWMPGLGRYGEISSASNCTDYQARRLNIRYRPDASASASSSPTSSGDAAEPQPQQHTAGHKDKKKGSGSGGSSKPEFVHTLNATACAVPRMIVAILETHQQEDGSVVVPPPLRPYMGGLEVIRPPGQQRQQQQQPARG